MNKRLSNVSTRKGNALFLVGAVVFVIFLLFGGFLRYFSNQKYATGKLSKSSLANELAFSIAKLAEHQITEIELKNKESKLYKTLSLSLNKMKKQTEQKLTLNKPLSDIANRLISLNPNLTKFSYDIVCKINRDSFSPLLAAYPSEKFGRININVNVSYKAAGSNLIVKEDYGFAFKIKITANLFPILSKFSFYVEDALNGGSSDKFNLVSTDAYGNLKGSAFSPWVFNNGSFSGANFPRRFSDIVMSPVGLIYLGGGEIVLGNCRGWNIPGKYSEGFHLLAEGRGDGLYTTGYIGNMALLSWETGLCNDQSDGPARFWWELIKDGYDKMSRSNSIFRLMGTDQSRSPTLVLGNVKSRTLCAKAFKEGNSFFGPLPYVRTQNRFTDICSGGSEDFDIGYFKSVVGVMTLNGYNSKYASSMIEFQYNRALGYIITNYKNPRPLESGVIAKSDPLHDFISGNAHKKGLSQEIPSPFSNIFSGISKLNSMDQIVKKIQIPGNRVLRTISLKKGEDFLKTLKNKGLFSNGKLILNGWYLIKSNAPIVINNPVLLGAHGGLVLEKGNILIRQPIVGGKEKYHLHLVTLDGNIIIDQGFSGKIQASLIAAAKSSNAGQLILRGKSNSRVFEICGNIAVKKIAKDKLNLTMPRGLKLNYFKDLAAIPNNLSDKLSEKPLLMFGISSKLEQLR
jgi:hypothetical protein